MKRIILFPPITVDDCWRAARCNQTEVTLADIDAKKTVAILAEHLRSQGYRGEGVLLAVPSSWCLSAQVSTESLPRHKRHETLLYRLEEKLPIAAETFVADFIRHTQGATGVCLPLAHGAPIVQALEAQGIVIDAIIPAALLALQKVVHADVDVIVLEHSNKAEIFLLDKQLPVGWYFLPLSEIQMPLALAAATLKRPLKIVAYALNTESRKALEKVLAEPATVHNDKFEEAAALAGAAVLEGKLTPWINLRRDALAPPNAIRAIKKPLIAAVAAMVFLCLAVSIALLMRAAHYNAVATEIVAQQESLFRQALPTQAVPVNVSSRLASEADKLAGLHGGTSQDQTSATSALVLLRDVVASIPTDLRIRFTELQVTPDHFYVEGQIRNHSDAERLAKALDQIHRWTISNPRTEQAAGGYVTFTITGGALTTGREGTR